jgi:folate-binding protein YgfZ
MSEVLEQKTARALPLDTLHKSHGAEMSERDGWMMPASYRGFESEYAAVRDGGAGVIDLSARGRFEVSGSEAPAFLNGLITNDVKGLEDGSWMTAAFPNVQGRLLAAVRVLRVGDVYLFDTEPATTAKVQQTLSRFVLAGDFRVADRTAELVSLSVQGKDSARIIADVLGAQMGALERNRVGVVEWQGVAVQVIRETHTAEDGFDLFVPVAAGAAMWEALNLAGATPVGENALNVLRIEAGIPRYGVDMDDSNVVLEAGLDDAVSFTKGCYIGQEIIARIHWRGHVAKKISGLILEEGKVERDSKLQAEDGKDAGRITSVTVSPRLGKTIALGLVKYNYLPPETLLRVVSDDAEATVTVAALPFVRGSWYGQEPGAAA